MLSDAQPARGPIVRKRGLWHRIRRIWATFGIVATVGFVGWCLIAYRASGEARRALRPGNDRVTIRRGEHHWLFTPPPTSPDRPVGLVFFAGSIVDPVAYAPLARTIAANGHFVVLMELPRRGAFGGANGDEVLTRARTAMHEVPDVREWVIAGHSRGGAVAARFLSEDESGVAGLVLLGTSHPRDVDLSAAAVPVTKILGTRDGVSAVEKSERNRSKLPASARWILIDGGNHSQFGYYGFQPGDRKATISREEQQRQTVAAVMDALKTADKANR